MPAKSKAQQRHRKHKVSYRKLQDQITRLAVRRIVPMPSKSRAQQRLFQAAEHGADFPLAKKLRRSMTHQQLHDFAVGSEKDKPEHVRQSHYASRAARGRRG